MAQKINPISFRLGLNQVWNYSLQIYGNSFNSYFKILHKYLQIQSFLFKFFHKNNFLLNYQEGKFHKNNFLLKIYYSFLPYSNKTKNSIFFETITETITETFKVNFSIYYFLKLSEIFTVNLVVAYVTHLLQQNVSSKKIILNLCKLFETNIHSCKFSYLKNGFTKVYLRGFKIRLSGRLDGSKNQMASSVEQTIGSLPLNCLKSYVEYGNKQIYTKSGICGLQIWLFYELNNNKNAHN